MQQTPHGSAAPVPSSALVYPRERVLHALMLAVSLAVYAGLVLAALAAPEVGFTIVFYGLLVVLVAFMARGLAIGRLRGDAIRVSERQFPLLHRLVAAHARRLGLAEVPTVYVVESGGLLNAFATRFLGRDFVVVNSDVLELAMQRGEAAVGFIVAHELGHVWRGHLRRRWLLAPARLVPYLGAAYSRACEYTCDRVGAHCQPDGAVAGLLVVAAGKQLYGQVDVRAFAEQAAADDGFWVRRAELLSSHPRLPKRVAALLRAGAALPEGTASGAAAAA